MTTPCQRYDALRSIIGGHRIDPNISSDDARFIVDHEKKCANPEHHETGWQSRRLREFREQQLPELLHPKTAEAHRTGVITKTSPHSWVLAALANAGIHTADFSDLVGCTYVFTFTAEAYQSWATQKGVVSGTVTGVSITCYPDRNGTFQVMRLSSSDVQVQMQHDRSDIVGRVVCCKCIGPEATVDDPTHKGWRLIVAYPKNRESDVTFSLSGTLRILPT